MDRIVGKSACEFLSGGVKMVRLTLRLCEGCNWPCHARLWGGGGCFRLLLRRDNGEDTSEHFPSH